VVAIADGTVSLYHSSGGGVIGAGAHDGPRRAGQALLSVAQDRRKPLYLTGMAVSVAHQGQGLGRLAMEDARTVARAWPADAIRLDAFDAGAGAGTFYLNCGYRERGHVTYRGTPLAYYELLLGPGMVAGR
jgi:GNAT superfamily N-acetyltransferase